MTNSIASTVEFTKRRELIRMREEIDRLREENERLSALAYRDPLTGLRNRRCFTERLNEELCRLKRNPTSALSVICIDVNDFKRLNDTQGHAAGDAALRAVAQVLENLVRSEDVVCRLGGDEFGVLLPDTDREQADRVVERIRAHAPVLSGVGLGPRALAVGLASWLYGDGEASLLARADEEMYADKRSARGEQATRSREPFVSAA
ncbi:MAG: GGDEF domain-containing protein [Archangium sp.]|nr:GGDEF domain-containing protein [Archangium sp.]